MTVKRDEDSSHMTNGTNKTISFLSPIQKLQPHKLPNSMPRPAIQNNIGC